MLLEVLGPIRVRRDCAELLDSPIGSVEGIGEAIQKKTTQLQLMDTRLCLLHSHGALQLLRHSFSNPKILHILHTALCFLSPTLQAYDDHLRAILGDITNVCFDEESV